METLQQSREDHAVFIYSAEPNSERHVRALCGAFDKLAHEDVRPFAVLGYKVVAGPQRCPACEEVAAVERRVFAEVPPDEDARYARARLMNRLRYGSYGWLRKDMAETIYSARRLRDDGGGAVFCMVLLNWTETPPAYYCDVDPTDTRTVRGDRDPLEWMRANWPSWSSAPEASEPR